MTESRKTYREGIIPYIALALLTAVVYLPTYPGFFVGDDYPHLYFSMTRNFLGMLDPQLTKYPVEMFYRPIGLLLWKIDYSIFGLDPGGYWLTNIGLHVVNTMLLLTLLKKAAVSAPAAFVSAALYGVYPLQSESVLWFTGRYYLTCIFFMLLFLISFLKYRGTQRSSFLALSFIFELLALLSNEAAIVLPALVATVAFLHMRNERPGRRAYKSVVAALPYAGLVIIYLAARFAYYKGIGGYSYATGGGVYQKVVSGVVASNLIGYFYRMLFPLNAYIFGERPWLFYSLLAIYAAILLMALASRKGAAGNILAGLLWVLFSLAPFIFILGQLGPGLTSNRFVAVAAVGLCFLIGSILFPGGTGGYLKSSGYVLSMLLVCAFSYITYMNDTAWTDAFRIAREIPGQARQMYPDLKPGAEMFFMGVPDYEKGAVVYQHGLRPSVNFAYGYKDYKPIKVYFVNEDGTIKDQKYTGLEEKSLQEVLQKRGHDVLVFKWDNSTGKLLDVSPGQRGPHSDNG